MVPPSVCLEGAKAHGRPTESTLCATISVRNWRFARQLLGSKLINMIAFTNLQQFSETIGNCDKSVCLHAKIQQV
jgi:hypothetical protein